MPSGEKSEASVRVCNDKIANMGFVCAMLVVFIHLPFIPDMSDAIHYNIWYVIRHLLASMAVPYFFLISGYFLSKHVSEEHWWKRAVRTRVNTLLIPFACWCGMMIVFQQLLLPSVSWLVGYKMTVQDLTLPVFLKMIGVNFCELPANGVLWYVRALMVFVVISPILIIGIRLLGVGLLYGLMALYFVWVLLGSGGLWKGLFEYGVSLCGLFWFACGCFIRLCGARKVQLLILALIYCVGSIAIRYFAAKDLLESLMPLVMFGLWKMMPESKWPVLLSGNAFPLFVTHMFFAGIVGIAIKHMGLVSCNAIILLLEWLVIVILSLSFSCLFRRLFPRMSVWAFGGR